VTDSADLKPAPRAVVFDLDGTLADTLEDITNAMNEVLVEIGHSTVTLDNMRGLVGEGLSVLIERATGITDADEVALLVKRYQPAYASRMLHHTRLYPRIDAALDALTGAGVSMCVLSNKPHYFTGPMCDALLSEWDFVRCLGHRDGHPRKPDPAAALELVAAMSRKPRDVFFVGDSAVDIKTAHNAGMPSIGVTWGFRDRDELVAAGAAHLVNTPAELAEVITGSAGTPQSA
jgi:phosphoglycolate phosphatase